jgi:CheY-like chemotaxis protein
MSERKPRILIAEDFDETRVALKLMLKLAGFDALEAENGQQAVEMILRENPDLVLMDITLPVIDGLRATREIRSREGLQSLPIIILSAHDDEEVRRQALAAGGTTYINKPIEFEELKKLIGSCLNIG